MSTDRMESRAVPPEQRSLRDELAYLLDSTADLGDAYNRDDLLTRIEAVFLQKYREWAESHLSHLQRQRDGVGRRIVDVENFLKVLGETELSELTTSAENR